MLPRDVKIMILMLAALVFAEAYADIGKVGGVIGKIGSPVVPSNLPKKKMADESADAPGEEKEKKVEHVPLLVIPFNQKRVNFERALSQAVLANEKNGRGVMYEVISSVPKNKGQESRFSDSYNVNSVAVMQQIVNSGVAAERVHSSTVYKDDITDQEIDVNYYVPEEAGAKADVGGKTEAKP